VSTLCASAARERADPLGATAATARSWLLIEHPGPWTPDALAGSGIAGPVRKALADAADSAGARLLLVRRPGRPVATAARMWAVVRHEPATVVRGRWTQDSDLLDAVAELAGDPPQQAEPSPLLLVCTHGRHDTCCALRGRPVAAALAQRWPDATWECSHVGGDRFAPNLLVVPDGAVYGNLATLDAADVVEAHLGGALRVDKLRGLSAFPPVVQAALIGAHERHGPAGARDAVPLLVERDDEHTWRVSLRGSGALPEAMTMRVTRTRREPHLLTCRAVAPSPAWTYAALPGD
jgi:hypothetical protein